MLRFLYLAQSVVIDCFKNLILTAILQILCALFMLYLSLDSQK